jgi:DNA-binding NarL/FixJ family response regulator
MTGPSATALVAAREGSVREGLSELLTSLPRIARVCVADETSLHLDSTSRLRPDLALFSLSMEEPWIWSLFQKIKRECPGARCVFLVEDANLEQVAVEAGADVVLRNGLPAAKLVSILESQLPPTRSKRTTPAHS